MYDGFHYAEDPSQYMDAPSTINNGNTMSNTSSMYTLDISQGSYFDLSPMLNVNDPVALHYLVQSAIAESKGFKVLSYQELDEAKKESQMLHSRVEDLNNKLVMEYKLKDAASSLSKLHQNEENQQASHRRSFFNGNGTSKSKRVSKHAEEEMDMANRKIANLENEVNKLILRAHEVDFKIMKHNTGVLALTHQSSSSSSAKIYEQHRKSMEGVPASDRMMRRSNLVPKDETHSKLSSCLGGQEGSTNELIESLISEYEKLKEGKENIGNGVTNGHVEQDKELNGAKEGKVKSYMQQQLDALSQSYEQNRAELEKLELENVDLKTNLRNIKFESQAKQQELENELRSNQERVSEWKERCETLKSELESVVRSLEDLTRQTVEYESERQGLEAKVNELQKQVYDTNTNRASTVLTETTTNEPTSVNVLRHEFTRIIQDLNNKHIQALKKEQAETKRLNSLITSIKTSSYAANLPPGKLESLGVQ